METITRNFLEIKSLNNLLKVNKPTENAEINLLIPPDFQLNKFLYNKIGKKYNWVDRLIWTDQDWIKYVSRFDMYTYILKIKNEIAGFFEIIFHKEKFEIEIVYLGLLKEYIGKKLGGYLLSEAIKKSFEFKIYKIFSLVTVVSIIVKSPFHNLTIFDTFFLRFLFLSTIKPLEQFF